MGDGAADSTSESEARVQSETLGALGGLDVLDDGVDLGRAGRLRRSHCDGREDFLTEKKK